MTRTSFPGEGTRLAYHFRRLAEKFSRSNAAGTNLFVYQKFANARRVRSPIRLIAR
jgi:hypothetical protein